MDCLRSLSYIGERTSCRRLVSLEHNSFSETSLSGIHILVAFVSIDDRCGES
jgi:hypothetical protein